MEMNLTCENLEEIIKAAIRTELEKINDTDPLFTREEAADYLRIKPNTLDIWASQGRGPAVIKLGVRAVYRKSSLDEFCTENILPR